MNQTLTLRDTFKQVTKSSSVEKGFMLLFLVTVFPLTYKVLSPFFIIIGLGGYTVYITSALYVIGCILTLPRFFKTIRPVDLIFYIIFFFCFYFSPLIYPLSSDFVNKNIHDTFLVYVPFYFGGLLIDYRRDRNLIKSVMRIAFLIAVFWQVCMLAGLVDFASEEGIGEQMEFAYAMLVVVCYMLIEYNNTHDSFELLAYILGSLMLLFMGTRGPVVLWAMFLAINQLIFHTFNRNNTLKKAVIVLLFVLFYFFSTPIVTVLSIIAVKFGLSTKVFDSILGNGLANIENSSGRDSIYERMIVAIKNDPTGFGYGFGGDRLFSFSHGYAHNFELEIFVQFGYIGGSILLLALLLFFFRAFKKVRGTESEEFLLVMFFWGFMSLQFSMSWLINPGFFFLVGYCVSIMRTRIKQ